VIDTPGGSSTTRKKVVQTDERIMMRSWRAWMKS